MGPYRTGTAKKAPNRSRISPKPMEKVAEEFRYEFRSNGTAYCLQVPVQLPFKGDARELTLRVMQAHNLPCYLEDDLSSCLQRFAREASQKMVDSESEEKLHGGSLFEKGSETEQTIQQWVESFSENYVSFSNLKEPVDDGVAFSEVYHKLIHSSSLGTLLQLEHTYAMAVSEMCKGWKNARAMMQEKHDSELAAAIKQVGTTKSESDIGLLTKRHTVDIEVCEDRWSSELNHLQESQKQEYREWVTKSYQEMSSSSSKGHHSAAVPMSRKRQDSERDYNPVDFSKSAEAQPLEESFTIHLGAQKKTMHNLRLLCGYALDLCRHKTTSVRGVVTPQPERLQTSMLLYSEKLSALVIMEDGRLNSLRGIKEAFAGVCHQSTDFHFPDIAVQLRTVQEFAQQANREKKEQKFTSSLSSQSSETVPIRSESPINGQERSLTASTDAPPTGPTPSSQPVSQDYLSLPSHTHGPGSSSSNSSGRSSPQPETSVKLEPGDFYITRHSNLSQVHVIMHLVTDPIAVLNPALRARHPVMMGLKNCLRAAARHDVHHITLPLLLVHEMQPEMTITWCLKRAELVFKCIKGFMLENSSWGEAGSRTIQFLIPPGISSDLFEEFCEMLPRVFRMATTKNITSRNSFR